MVGSNSPWHERLQHHIFAASDNRDSTSIPVNIPLEALVERQ